MRASNGMRMTVRAKQLAIAAMEPVSEDALRCVLARRDVCAFADAVTASRLRGGRKGYKPMTMVGMVAIRRLWSYANRCSMPWTDTLLLVEMNPALARAVGCRQGVIPGLSACYRFERQHAIALDGLLGGDGPAVHEWSPQEIIRALRQWKGLYGSWPTANDWNPAAIKNAARRARAETHYRGQGYPSLRVVQLVFGSWSDALDIARSGATLGASQEPRSALVAKYRDALGEHREQAAAAHFAWKERPRGSRSPGFTKSLDAPLGDEGRTLHDVLAEQGALDDDDDMDSAA